MEMTAGEANACTGTGGVKQKVRFDPSVVFQDELEGDALITKLRRDLSSLRNDLAQEKKNRKRKDRNIVKMAKELNNRFIQGEETSKQVEELEETIVSYTEEEKQQLENTSATTTNKDAKAIEVVKQAPSAETLSIIQAIPKTPKIQTIRTGAWQYQFQFFSDHVGSILLRPHAGERSFPIQLRRHGTGED